MGNRTAKLRIPPAGYPPPPALQNPCFLADRRISVQILERVRVISKVFLTKELAVIICGRKNTSAGRWAKIRKPAGPVTGRSTWRDEGSDRRSPLGTTTLPRPDRSECRCGAGTRIGRRSRMSVMRQLPVVGGRLSVVNIHHGGTGDTEDFGSWLFAFRSSSFASAKSNRGLRRGTQIAGLFVMCAALTPCAARKPSAETNRM